MRESSQIGFIIQSLDQLNKDTSPGQAFTIEADKRRLQALKDHHNNEVLRIRQHMRLENLALLEDHVNSLKMPVPNFMDYDELFYEEE